MSATEHNIVKKCKVLVISLQLIHFSNILTIDGYTEKIKLKIVTYVTFGCEHAVNSKIRHTYPIGVGYCTENIASYV